MTGQPPVILKITSSEHHHKTDEISSPKRTALAVSEWLNLTACLRQWTWGPYNWYKLCNHNLFIGFIIFPHNLQVTNNLRNMDKKETQKARALHKLTCYWKQQLYISLQSILIIALVPLNSCAPIQWNHASFVSQTCLTFALVTHQPFHISPQNLDTCNTATFQHFPSKFGHSDLYCRQIQPDCRKCNIFLDIEAINCDNTCRWLSMAGVWSCYKQKQVIHHDHSSMQ